MRVTASMIHQDALRSLRGRLAAVSRAQLEVGTGRRIQSASDDPVGTSQLLRLGSALRASEQYHRNAVNATAKISIEEAILGSVHDALAEAREVGAGAANAAQDDPVRQTALAMVRGVRHQVLSSANTKLGDEYLFAGSQSSTQPFDEDGTYHGDAVGRRVQIAPGSDVETVHPGSVAFEPALQALLRLEQELESGDAASILSAASDLEAATGLVAKTQAEAGTRKLHVEQVEAQLLAASTELLDEQAKLRDADPTESAVRLLTAQTALEQAYAAVGNVLAINILQFLR
jgi:flagellar hook-associated protein 3 FlgL